MNGAVFRLQTFSAAIASPMQAAKKIIQPMELSHGVLELNI
jgi:hypothetical protein